jgi:hypothetical protein
MWKLFLNAVLEAFAMSDPVAYMYYIENKREAERQAALTPHRESVQGHVDQWVAFSERMGVWQNYEDAIARRLSEETPA